MLSDLNLTSSGCVLCASICDPSSSQFPSACFYFILKLPHFGWNLPSWFSSHIIVQYHWPPFPHSYTQIKAASYFAHDVIDLLLPTGVGSCCPCIAHCFHLLRPFSSCSHPSSLFNFLIWWLQATCCRIPDFPAKSHSVGSGNRIYDFVKPV